MLHVPKLFRRAPLAAGVVVVAVSALALSGCEAAQDAAEKIPGVGASDDETTPVAESTPVLRDHVVPHRLVMRDSVATPPQRR